MSNDKSKTEKQDIERDITAAFGNMAKISATMLEHYAGMDAEELAAAMPSQMFSTMSKFIKDNEARIQLSEDKGAEKLLGKLDEATNVIDAIQDFKYSKEA